MATKLSISRTQWAVGNGFFHSGNVSTVGFEVNYVYDCGARSDAQIELARETEEFRRRVERVDFMFVSHFEFDHVSGIPLLTDRIDIERFVIPLVPSVERLFILGGCIVDGSYDGDGPGREFYDDFIIDPSAALASLTSNNSTPALVQVIPPAQSAPPATSAEMPELLSPAKIQGARVAAQLVVGWASERVTCGDGMNILWEWFPYVATQARGATPNFSSALVRRGVIRSESELDSPKRVRDIVKRHRDELAGAYTDAVATVGRSFTRNLTSLMLYSGPVVGAQHRAYRTRNTNVERAEIGAWDPRPGWLGLGDDDLRATKRVDEVNGAFQSRKPLVGTFAPSHHGSGLDWDDALMDGFDPSSMHRPTFVFGAAGSYRSPVDNAVLHPSGDVLLRINEAGGTAITVGRSETSRWTESMSVFIEP